MQNLVEVHFEVRMMRDSYFVEKLENARLQQIKEQNTGYKASFGIISSYSQMSKVLEHFCINATFGLYAIYHFKFITQLLSKSLKPHENVRP